MTCLKSDKFWMIAYCWALSVLFAMYFGRELALSETERVRREASEALYICYGEKLNDFYKKEK